MDFFKFFDTLHTNQLQQFLTRQWHIFVSFSFDFVCLSQDRRPTYLSKKEPYKNDRESFSIHLHPKSIADNDRQMDIQTVRVKSIHDQLLFFLFSSKLDLQTSLSPFFPMVYSFLSRSGFRVDFHGIDPSMEDPTLFGDCTI